MNRNKKRGNTMLSRFYTFCVSMLVLSLCVACAPKSIRVVLPDQLPEVNANVDIAPVTLNANIETGRELRSLMEQTFVNLYGALGVAGEEARHTIESAINKLGEYTQEVDQIIGEQIADVDSRLSQKMHEIQYFAERMNEYAKEIIRLGSAELQAVVRTAGDQMLSAIHAADGATQAAIRAAGEQMVITIQAANIALQTNILLASAEAQKVLQQSLHGMEQLIQQAGLIARRLPGDTERSMLGILLSALLFAEQGSQMILAILGAIIALCSSLLITYGWGNALLRIGLPTQRTTKLLVLGLMTGSCIVALFSFALLFPAVRTKVLSFGGMPKSDSTLEHALFTAQPVIWKFTPDPVIVIPGSPIAEFHLVAQGSNLLGRGKPSAKFGTIDLEVVGATEDEIKIALDPVFDHPAAAQSIQVTFDRDPSVYAVQVLVPEPTPIPTITPEASTQPMVTIIGQLRVNVRLGPGTNYTVIGSAPPGETFTVLAKSQDGTWWQVQFGSQKGWIFHELVSAQHIESTPIEYNIPALLLQAISYSATAPQVTRSAYLFNIALVQRCERQPAGNWFEGTIYANGQPQNGQKVVFSYAPDGPHATAPAISGPHDGYPNWAPGYYSHIINAPSVGPKAGEWYAWIINERGNRISEIAHWKTTGGGEGCNQSVVDFDSR